MFGKLWRAFRSWQLRRFEERITEEMIACGFHPNDYGSRSMFVISKRIRNGQRLLEAFQVCRAAKQTEKPNKLSPEQQRAKDRVIARIEKALRE